MNHNNEVYVELYSIGITESYSEEIKEVTLFLLKDNIIDSDVLQAPVVFTDSVSDGIWVDNSDGKYERFTVVTYSSATLVLIDNTILIVANSSKL